MSDDNSKPNNNRSLGILTVVGILGFAAGMIWYNVLADDIRRKKLFKKMKYYQSRLVGEMI
jgi:hypothetical protein